MQKGYAFISYSTKNQAAADSIRELLKRKGIATWMAPGDIPAGSKYAQVINRAVKECSCFVLVLTEDAQNSVWVAKEVERAINYRRPIIPVQLEDVTLNDEFELYISSDQLVAIRKIDEDSEEVQRLLAGIIPYTGTFESLGHLNQDAIKACKKFSEGDARHSFICLLGRNYKVKKQLLEEITYGLNRRSADSLYVQMGQFTEELCQSILNETTAMFHQKYEQIDVLLFDDVERIDCREATQEEFYYLLKNRYFSRKATLLLSPIPSLPFYRFDDFNGKITDLVASWECFCID